MATPFGVGVALFIPRVDGGRCGKVDREGQQAPGTAGAPLDFVSVRGSYCCMPSGHWTKAPLANVMESLKAFIAPPASPVQPAPPSLPPEQIVYSVFTAVTTNLRMIPYSASPATSSNS